MSHATGPGRRTRDVTLTADFSNTRTRIVGERTGVVADALVALVRGTRRVRGAIAAGFRRAAAVVSPLGWIFAVAVPVCFVVGYRLGWLEYVAAAWAGLLLIGVAGFALLGRNRFEVALDLGRRRVVVGEPASVDLVVVNAARRRVLGSTIEVPIGDGLAEIAVPSLRGGAEYRHSVQVPTGHRGVIGLGPVRSVRADPIGLVRREVLWTERQELVVHPRTISVPSTSTGLIRDLEGVATRDLTASDVSFHALREYLPGDDRRNIHWRSTAKTGVYMVRQFEQTRRSHLVVGLSLATQDYASEEELELAVSVAGSLGVRAIRDGRSISVVVGERTPEFARRRLFAVRPLSVLRPDRLLDDLANVTDSSTALPLREIGRVVADTVTGISVAFLICGSRPSTAELRAASAAFPAEIEVIAVVCDPDANPGLRRVAGLNVLRVGYLEDLRAALARAAAVA